jgi:tRNA (guanine37-N1)-methyltransferase
VTSAPENASCLDSGFDQVAAERRPAFRVAIVTLFPELFESFLRTSFIGRARRDGLLHVHLEHLREHGLGVHRAVDDTPYGGGPGMVMRVDCVVASMESAEQACEFQPKGHRILLTPHGSRFTQEKSIRWVELNNLVFVCGRYEGFDERIRAFVDEESSLGDFILMGGEIPAMAAVEACTRLLDGVLGNSTSVRDESFSAARSGMLEYPQYTRPLTFRGHEVPEVLRSGDHAKIQAWRDDESRARTRARRPDLLANDSTGDGR